MSKTAKKINKASIQVFIFVAIVFILLLTSINIKNFLNPKKVLGAETTEPKHEEFWQQFLNENPNYVPGWIEIGRIDKAKEIDPNYF